MATYTQANQPLAVTTPLGPDGVLLAGLQGREALSEPFLFHLDLLARNPLPFDQLLGQPATVRMSFAGSPQRYINGIIVSLEQGPPLRGPEGKATFIRYRAELVPQLWLLGRRVNSRVFQDLAVPDILQQVLHGDWGLEVHAQLTGTYPPRDYCVQYHETDLAFVSRLMEEEGICYYFRHTEKSHTLVLTDCIDGHPDLEGESRLIYDDAEGGRRDEGRIQTWRKRQVLRSCKHTLRDHCFQLPTSTLEATSPLTDQVQVGQVGHTLKHSVAKDGQELLEVYDYPGRYAWRLDGVNREGGNQPQQVQGLFQENQRVAHLRMEEDAAAAVQLEGESNCSHLLPGCKFTLTHHFDGDGTYLLTSVEHRADLESAYLSDAPTGFLHENRFQALPAALPFRPARTTPRPVIPGCQTATVVGPKGNDIFVDRYGRVKVKFHWDRRDDSGPESSCWLRVGQLWAGNRWGAYFWPRVGHEVLVVFEEGDPDRPLVAGSVYNERNMPPYALPDNRTLGGIKSFTSTGNPQAQASPLANYNGILFNDLVGQEHLELHGEKHIAFCSEETHLHDVEGAHRLNVDGFHSVHVGSAPGGSGSGGTGVDPDYPYQYSGPSKARDWLGVEWGTLLTSVSGLNQEIYLGLFSQLTVGSYINVVVNPIGMIADLGWTAEGAAAGVTAAITAIGAVGGGVVNCTMGSQTALTYGTNMTITRGAKAAISEAGLWKGGTMTKGERVWAAATNVLAGIIATLNTAGTYLACADNYSTKQKDWQALLYGSSGAMALLGMVEVFRVTYNQVQKAREVAEKSEEDATTATTIGQTNVGNLKAVADFLVTLTKADQQNQNTAHYVKGTTIECNDASRVIGADKSALFFVGQTKNQQSGVSLLPKSIQIGVGGVKGGLVLMSPDSILIKVGPPASCPQIAIAPDSWTLSMGDDATATTLIKMEEDAITLKAGTASLKLSADDGITVVHNQASGLQLKSGQTKLVGTQQVTVQGTAITLKATQANINASLYNNGASVLTMK